MNFLQGVRHPIDYLTEKADFYGDDAVKPALIWSSAIAGTFALLMFLIATFFAAVLPIEAQMALIPFAGIGAISLAISLAICG